MTSAASAIVLLLTALPVAWRPAAAGPVDAVAGVVLEDQLGRPDALERHRGRPVLALVVEARGLRQLRDWEVALRERLPDLDYFRIADVPTGRGITRERILGRLEDRVPEEVSILIDMEGRWARALELDTRLPNLLLFDRDLRLTHLFRGRRSDLMVGQVVDAVSSLEGPESAK